METDCKRKERGNSMKKRKLSVIGIFAGLLSAGMILTGCGDSSSDNGKIKIEMVQYKPEAVKAFEKMEEKFNASHDDIELTIESPNEAMTILKTRFIKEDQPDIIGIGGDVNYSNFLDADMLTDISDFEGLADIKQAYLDIDKNLEFISRNGVYAVPYAANAAGILYNKDMFEENGWEIPTTWEGFLTLLDTIQASGQQPLYFGFKDTWTCLAPWNAMACDLAPADVCQQVNRGETTFSEEYRELAEKILQLLPYAQDDPYAYSYNDACTAFARGESAMYCIGSYAVPQIKSVNPEMNIDSFVFPANDSADGQILNSGIDLQFCIMEDCKEKEAAYEVLRFMLEDENIQIYLDDQNAVPCKEGEFQLPSMLDGMKEYIDAGKMTDYQDHYYPTEMAVDAMIQTYLMKGDTDAWLKKFDRDWTRYNRDLIRKIQDYQKENGEGGNK